MHPVRKLSFLLAFCITFSLLLTACSGGGGGGGGSTPSVDTTPPSLQSTSPANGASNVSLNSQVTLTWSEAVDCTTVNTSTITISPATTWTRSSCSGNQASFIPAGQANATTYTISLGAGVTDVAGNQQSATSFSYTTAAAIDTTPPAVQSTSPVNNASNVGINTPVVITWNEPVDCSTVTTGTITISPAVTTWTQTSCSGTRATFTPTGQSYATPYVIGLGAGVTDVAGNPETATSISYTTAAAPDTTPPVLQSSVPTDGATDITVNAPVTLTWNEAVNCNTVNTTNVTIAPGSWTRTSCTGSQAVFTPTGQASSTTYTVTVNGSVTDVAGNAGSSGSFSYTTAVPPDTTPPTLQSTLPADGATGVSADSTVTLTWSEAVNCATVTTGNITISPAVTWDRTSCSSNQAVFTPTGQSGTTSYTVTVNGNVTDVAGNAGTGGSFSYTTAALPDTTPPTVSLTSPVDGATNVAVNSSVEITWNEAVNCSTVNTTNITISPAATWNLSSCSGNQAIFTPAGQQISTPYTVQMANVQDSAGNTAATSSFSYTTAATTDTTPPTLTTSVPADGAKAVVVDSRVWLEWSEPIDCTTVDTSSVTLTPNPGWTLVDCSDNLGRAVFEPSNQVEGTTYTVTATTAVKDLAGNAMAANVARTYTAALPANQPFPATQDAVESLAQNGNSAVNSVPITVDAAPLQRTLYSTTVFPTSSPMGDFDWYSVALTAGTKYEISVSYLNATGDSYLDLFYNDPNNGGALTLIDSSNFNTYGTAELGFQDDYLGLGSEIIFTPNVSATFKFRVISRAQSPHLLLGNDWGPIGMLAYTVSVHQFIDNDNDTFSSYYDCNDAAANINYLATDTPGDLVDQDCSGTDEIAPTTPDAAEPDSFSAPLPLLERQAGEEYIYQPAVFVNNQRTLDNAADKDYFSLTLAPFEKVILTVPITIPAPAILQADVYTQGQLETATPVFSGPAQDLAITNTSASAVSYIVRFSGASAAGGYYVPTFYSVGVDSDDGGVGDGFYTEAVDLNRDCNDSLGTFNPAASDPTSTPEDENCDGGNGSYILGDFVGSYPYQ